MCVTQRCSLFQVFISFKKILSQLFCLTYPYTLLYLQDVSFPDCRESGSPDHKGLKSQGQKWSPYVQTLCPRINDTLVQGNGAQDGGSPVYNPVTFQRFLRRHQSARGWHQQKQDISKRNIWVLKFVDDRVRKTKFIVGEMVDAFDLLSIQEIPTQSQGPKTSPLRAQLGFYMQESETRRVSY